MNFEKVTNGLAKLKGTSGLALQKNSPELLLGVGVIGIITSTVLACQATLKIEYVLDEHKDKIDKVHEGWDMVLDGTISRDEYTENDKRKDLAVTYLQTGAELLKLYGLPIAIGAASIACIIGGHNIMKKRNLALVAAFKAVEEGFAAYRKRVVEEHGEQADYMYKNGLRANEITQAAYTDTDGVKHKAEKKTIVEQDPNGLSTYARFFDQMCSQWTKTAEYNLMFLKAQQNYFNDMLRARGHVFLNEVYDSLGIPRSQAGAVVGWVLGAGDDFIDFGIFDGDRPRARDFVNGHENSILLDFNVDGVIYDLFTVQKV
jgi:hypothetical protein